jgi:hypothetical protein
MSTTTQEKPTTAVVSFMLVFEYVNQWPIQ